MFTPEERRRIDRLLDYGFEDSFRKFHSSEEKYTWWPYYAHARERNLGWRIDYIFASKIIVDKLKDAFILENMKGSDYCPVGIRA